MLFIVQGTGYFHCPERLQYIPRHLSLFIYGPFNVILHLHLGLPCVSFLGFSTPKLEIHFSSPHTSSTNLSKFAAYIFNAVVI